MSPTCRVEFAKAKETGLDAVACAKRLIEDESKLFPEDQITTPHENFLPDLTFIIYSDNAELRASAHNCTPYDIFNLDSQYSARFRIPPTTLYGLSEEECQKRAQWFAVGSLLYTVMAGKPPYEDLDEGLAQHNFKMGVYPTETMEYPLEIAIEILGFWSQEFAQQYAHHSKLYSFLCPRS